MMNEPEQHMIMVMDMMMMMDMWMDLKKEIWIERNEQ
jgi:hypothetical protein